MSEWKLLAISFPGWSLQDVMGMSPRERKNWLEVAREFGKVVKSDG